MAATSLISTRKGERPRARLSLGPMRGKMRAAGIEGEIGGNEAFAFLAEEFFDDGVAATDDEEFAGVVEFGADVAAVCGEFREGGEDIELGGGRGGGAEAGGFGGDAGTDVDEKLALDFEDAFVGGEDFSFVIL